MVWVWLAVFIVLVAAGWLMTWLGLPGNWLILAAAAGYLFLVPGELRIGIGWMIVVGLGVLASLGELLELAAGALGVAKAGGSRRGTVLALIGSMLGGIVGIFIGVPIPVIGSLVAAVLFGGLGALLGALAGERWKGKDFDESLQVGKAAFVGRVLGTGAKILCGTLMVVLVGMGLVVR